MEHTNAFLEKEPVSKLMRMYSVPCIISLLVAALYNIVDQIFIANASYLGSYGNAANTVVFPLTIVALAIAVMIGDGACAYVSILLGMKRKDEASGTVGNAVLLTIVSGLVITAFYLGFSKGILTVFGLIFYIKLIVVLIPVSEKPFMSGILFDIILQISRCRSRIFLHIPVDSKEGSSNENLICKQADHYNAHDKKQSCLK